PRSTLSGPRLTSTERPVLPLHEDQIDHDIVRADVELGLELIGDELIEGKLSSGFVADCASYLNQNEIGRSFEPEKIGVENQVFGRMLADDDKPVAVGRLQDIDDA